MIQLLNPLKLQPKGIPASPAPFSEQARTMKFTYGTGERPLAGYSIKRGVGIGGFGEVYFALNDAGKEVALKRIQRNLDVEVRGVRQCLNLKHPNLIALFDIQFDAHEQGWIVMEYVSGSNLRDLLERYPTGLPMDQLCHWFGQIVAGVTYLHDHGVVHRDLKPANVFEDQGIVKIGDYGLSKYISCSRRGGQTESVGTFHYMAPEIGKGEYGKEIDVYALGIMLYEMATGNVPFDGESTQEIVMKHLTADPDLSRVSWPVREVVARALQKDPTARYRDAREMVRPLGLEIDQRYMVTTTSNSNLPPVVSPVAAVANGPSPLNAAAVAALQGNHHAAGSEKITGEQESLHYEEPIAEALRSSWTRVAQWWREMPLHPGSRAMLVAIGIIALVLKSAVLIQIFVTGLMIYVPYYIVWCFVSSSRSGRAATPTVKPGVHKQMARPFVAPQQAQVARPVSAPVAPKAPFKPLSVRQWKAAKRRQLGLVSTTNSLADVTGGWFTSSIVLAVFCSLVAVFQIGTGHAGQAQLISIAWTAIVSMICAWSVIALGKRWQSSEGDWAVRSFIQVTVGLGIGWLAYVLSDFLAVGWSSSSGPEWQSQFASESAPTRRWPGFFDAQGQPLLPAFLAYFPLMMGLVHWWKQVDPLRRTQFSLLSVIWSVIAAWLVHLLIPFPLPWGAVVAAGTSVAVQLASPWLDPEERHQLDPARSIG